jgi:hypothetical protein
MQRSAGWLRPGIRVDSVIFSTLPIRKAHNVGARVLARAKKSGRQFGDRLTATRRGAALRLHGRDARAYIVQLYPHIERSLTEEIFASG